MVQWLERWECRSWLVVSAGMPIGCCFFLQRPRRRRSMDELWRVARGEIK